MENSTLTPTRYVSDYEKLAERVGESLRDYLGDPSEEGTRSVRASVRRLSTCIGILPKKARNKATRQCRARSRKLLALTSMIRDIDVMRARLISAPRDATIDLLLRNMAEERQEYVGQSMKAAWKLFEVRGPKLAKRDVTRVSQWLVRTLEELDEQIMEELPLVIKNEGRIDELHSLRKHAKRFRYILEVVPVTGKTTKVTEMLRGWQDVLGEIRDSDVLIDYLGRARQSAAVRDLLVTERNSRHKRYLSFVRSYKRASGGRVISLLAATGLRQSSATSKS